MILILGKNSFIGKSLYCHFKNKNKHVELIGSTEFLKSDQNNYKTENIVVFDCVGVSRGSDNEFFEINFHQKVKIIDKLLNIKSLNKTKITYVFFNSIHKNLSTLYGHSKLFTTYLMKGILSKNDIFCLDITLCGMYGLGVMPYKYSVVGTFYNDLKLGLKSYINEDESLIEISNVKRIFEFIDEIGLTNGSYDQNYSSHKIEGSRINVKKLYQIMKNIINDNQNISEENFYSILTRSLELANEK